jgi:hypothetical protein
MYLCTIATSTDVHQFLSHKYPKAKIDAAWKDGYFTISDPNCSHTLYLPAALITRITIETVADDPRLKNMPDPIRIHADLSGLDTAINRAISAAAPNIIKATIKTQQRSRDRNPNR